MTKHHKPSHRYKGERVRLTIRMPVALYHTLIDRMRDDDSLNDYIVRYLERLIRSK